MARNLLFALISALIAGTACLQLTIAPHPPRRVIGSAKEKNMLPESFTLRRPRGTSLLSRLYSATIGPRPVRDDAAPPAELESDPGYDSKDRRELAREHLMERILLDE
jgi:hypothetical protein